MSSIPDHIQIKLDNVASFHSKIKEMCLKHIDSPNEKQLKGISIYVGEMSQTLRSALNNTMWDFCEKKLKNILPEDEHTKVKWSHDFPIEGEKSSFEKSKIRVLRHIAKHYPVVYQFIERVQPYHEGYKSLASIKILSNDSSHTIPVEVRDLNIKQIAIQGFSNPVISGNEVIVQWSSNSPAFVYSIPCYVEEMMMYVSKEKKWMMFQMSINGKAYFSPTPFSKGAPSLVSKLIMEFYTLW
jgi:hypothetical protein